MLGFLLFAAFSYGYWRKVSRAVAEDAAEIVVADSGISIPPSLRNAIFEPFQCSDASRKSKDGSGLGLAIARRVMQLHGGSLRVEQPFPGYTKAFVARL